MLVSSISSLPALFSSCKGISNSGLWGKVLIPFIRMSYLLFPFIIYFLQVNIVHLQSLNGIFPPLHLKVFNKVISPNEWMVFKGPSTTQVILGTLTYSTLMRTGNNIHVQQHKTNIYKWGMEQNTKWCPFCRHLQYACCHLCSARLNARCVNRRTAVVYSYTPIKPHGVSQAKWFPFQTIFTSRKKYRNKVISSPFTKQRCPPRKKPFVSIVEKGGKAGKFFSQCFLPFSVCFFVFDFVPILKAKVKKSIQYYSKPAFLCFQIMLSNGLFFRAVKTLDCEVKTIYLGLDIGWQMFVSKLTWCNS